MALSRFQLLHAGLDTSPIFAELAAHPGLWNEYHERRTAPGSPHADMEDIWVRARSRDDLAEPDAFRLPHAPVFYPAWKALPSIHPIVWTLAHGAVQLGNILVTRLPPGGRIGTHTDSGWAAEWFNRKFYVVLQGNARCVNTCEGEEVAMRTGETWMFDNLVPHGVENHGTEDRLSLIVTVRVEA